VFAWLRASDLVSNKSTYLSKIESKLFYFYGEIVCSCLIFLLSMYFNILLKMIFYMVQIVYRGGRYS
jgi:hypothetical protein